MRDSEKAEQIVYISCVDEVRYSFVSHLSEALRRIRIIDVFVDSNDLLSKEAQAKLERARVSVMVLPANRQPTTSLGKLVKVLEYLRSDDQVVIPVLYGLRKVGSEWHRSLQMMSGLSQSHESRKECSDSELVEEIVRDVYEKLFYMSRIGIYPKLLEIQNMINKQPLGIRSVGIWGMPGIGKTTLAEAVFEQISGDFDACCIIKDYDKAVHEKGLYRLLEEQFLKETPAVGGNVTKLGLLRNKLSNKKILVVLGNVFNPLAAESFLGRLNGIGPESLIIITSRDKQVFHLCRLNQVYEVQGLKEKEALHLFSLCASINNVAEQNHRELSMRVINYANGNPLALSIYGGRLKGKKKLSEMETAFLKLLRHPPFKIFEAFKSSYDTLSDTEKNVFLDIACFFQGEKVDYVMQLLEGCGFHPHVGIDVLVEKCLVTVSENRVWMHNLTKDVGQEIINRETIQIERRSRLWKPWTIKYLLEDNNQRKANKEPKTTFKRAQGTEEIEGMFLDTSNLSFDVKHAAFEKMSNLRLLKIYSSNPGIHPAIRILKGSLHSLPNELRLLHWENYPLQSLPQNFDPKHLVEISMPCSQLQKLWGGTKNLQMLRTIRLCHSQLLVDIHDLLKAQNLEVIDLQGCTRLQSLPALGQLLNLQDVNFSGCVKIKSLPEVPSNIEILRLQGTGIKELPSSIVKPNYRELVNRLSGVSNFEHSDLERLTSLMELSSSNQDLGKLICLDLKDCSQLRSLPNMVSLESLKVLDLSGCSELETIQGFPWNLKELYLAGTAVREVPQLPQSLELLNAHGCVSLKSIRLDPEQLPMHYTFSNCFDLSPRMVNDFLVKVLTNVKHMPRECQQELNKAMAFSFCVPSHANQDSALNLQPGNSVMTTLSPSWRSTLVGFTMILEVAFLEDYCDVTGFGIDCICRWKDKKGLSHRIKRNLLCWPPGKAVQKNHMFAFCDVEMRPRTNEGGDPNICADIVVFEFFTFNNQMKRIDGSCTVTRCGVYVITTATDNTSLENILPALSLDPVEFSDNEVEEVWRVSYDGLRELDKALFLYIVCLLNDEDVDLAAPITASINLDVSSGLKILANRSLIRISSNGAIVMDYLLRQMGKEILHRQSKPPGRSEVLTSEKALLASCSSGKGKYDVYLSFSGTDVGKNFISRLFVALEHGLNTRYRDGVIGRGQSISLHRAQAIRESRVLIVVFSKYYASSSWLLNELVEIAKSREELSHIVIPIFYGVDRLHVRKQTGEFGRQFELTCVDKTEVEKQGWRRALINITNILGYHYAGWDNKEDMMETIGNDISRKLTASEDFFNVVGIEDHISRLNTLLRLESKKVRMVGIWGPSGVGKSTIARALYSRLACQFQSSIFVDKDYIYKTMKNAKRARLDDYSTKLHLQTQFVSEIIGEKYTEIRHLGKVRETLKDQKVLIILDEVDDLVLLDALVGQRRWLGPGSRIILITEDKRLRMSHQSYKVSLPSKNQALQIFCQYAFGEKSPSDGFMELATEVSKVVGNLPLGLKVIGSSLRGTDKREWIHTLARIRNCREGEIGRILRLAYERLGDHDKSIFLHIACFFNNHKVEYATRSLAYAHLDVRTGFGRLVEKSLIHISEQGNIGMHCLLQGLGREIVRKLSIQNPASRQFLLDSTEIYDIFVENTGTKRVLGISLDKSLVNEVYIKENAFKRMKNLKFLRIYSSGNKEVKLHSCDGFSYLPRRLSYLPRRLRLLRWEEPVLKRIPSSFRPQYLVEIIMEHSKLEKLWSGVQPLQNLAKMELSGCETLKELPDLSMATNLEKLILNDCMSLMELTLPSIQNLNKLTTLEMIGCSNLETLPTGIDLKSLYCLNLSGCSKLRSFPDISSSVVNLYLNQTEIEEVPEWISNFSRLTTLELWGCQRLKRISPRIFYLGNLDEVFFSNCKHLAKVSWLDCPKKAAEETNDTCSTLSLIH